MSQARQNAERHVRDAKNATTTEEKLFHLIKAVEELVIAVGRLENA